ncbi:hypothetical protein F2Q68_00040885 [Brassica cretica]|uniref:Uncharacterized protein n=3 Tax=Brassica cretica TaxID=69181 RepID=A0ABQ7DH83_BRACR|nr:hypothetical protein F2Q68_00040885 [Brassica cretica]KAF3576733.1 hypothetical protein DY000_02033256 [Brassica cretica]
MALFPETGSWRGFLEQVSGTGTQFGNDETQPPSPQPPSPEIEMDDVPVPNAPTIHVDLMTLDELLLAPGRSDLPKLYPKRVNGAGWYLLINFPETKPITYRQKTDNYVASEDHRKLPRTIDLTDKFFTSDKHRKLPRTVPTRFPTNELLGSFRQLTDDYSFPRPKLRRLAVSRQHIGLN